MTWYRVGPAGIPGSLKTDMNTILNKKFGTTAQDYPPADWPADVNLLGPLPEKTASGAIAHIDDGADGVPLKNWLVTLPASLSGYSEVNGTKSGANLFDEEWESGWIDNNGAEAVNASRVRSKNYNTIKGDVLYYVVASYSWRVYFYDASKTFISYVGTYTANRSITSPANAVYFRFAVIDTAPTSICLNYPSTDTAYHAYNGAQYTASLGRTIYGGQADIVTGEGEATYKGYNLGSLTWSGGIVGGQMWCWYCDLSADGLKLPTNSNIFDGICVDYTPIRFNGVSSNANTIALRSNGVLYVNNGSDTIEPTGNVTIAFDAPTPFTFTPITAETALGVNNFWAEEGDSEVTYRADISLALNA